MNRRIVARLKLLDASRSFKEMLDYSIGNTVEFGTNDGRLIQGTVSRLNRKGSISSTQTGCHVLSRLFVLEPDIKARYSCFKNMLRLDNPAVLSLNDIG